MDIEKKIRDEIVEASKLINDRGDSYGNAVDNHVDIKNMWDTLLRNKLSTNLTTVDVAALLIALKMARLMKSPDHKDSMQDIICYAGIMVALSEHEEKQRNIIENIAQFQGGYNDNVKES